MIWGTQCFSVGWIWGFFCVWFWVVCFFLVVVLFYFFNQSPCCWAHALSVPVVRKRTSCSKVGRWWWRASEGQHPGEKAVPHLEPLGRWGMPGFPSLGCSLLLVSAFIFYIGGWAGKPRLLSLEYMEGERIFFKQGFCASAAMPFLGLEEQGAELLFRSLYEREGSARCCWTTPALLAEILLLSASCSADHGCGR